MLKKICIVTGTRAEYGQLHLLMKEINNSKKLSLQVLVTGTHLSKNHGYTVNEIIKDKIKIDKKIDINISSDKEVSILNSMAIGLTKFYHGLINLKPDLVLILGDRYEMLSVAISCLLSRIPIGHIHGGELTEGLIDDPIRHSLTKMSHIHFTCTSEYKKRVIQLGENPVNVYNVGGLSVDNLKKIDLLTKSEIEQKFNFKFLKKNLLITFHPLTLIARSEGLKHLNELLLALKTLEDTLLIFTMPNADPHSRKIFTTIKKYCSTKKNALIFSSLGYINYLSCLKYVDAVVGNSSSGLVEVPSFKKATINIGDRQKGRIKAKSVIDCMPTKKDILESIKKSYSKSFKSSLKKVKNPYGNGGSIKKIIKVLENKEFNNLIKKQFYDLK